jgi:hypothetical protein
MAERTKSPADAKEDSFPYRLRDYFLSKPETALFRALKQMAGDRYAVFAKVALTEIFQIVRPNENVHYFNKIFRKHVDFLLCDPGSLRPEIGVELVRTAAKNEGRASDQFMEDLFMRGGLPLVRIPVSDRYDISEIIRVFQEAIKRNQQGAGERVPASSQDSVPMCPVCGKMMVLRKFPSGSREGELYYGCMDNPHCPGMVAIK